jgi:methylmalonyl-CoA mutase
LSRNFFMAIEKSILALLKENFPKTNNANWKQTASQEIGGKDPYVELRWRSTDSIDLLPYYDAGSTASLHYLEKFNITADKNSFLGARQWFNTPIVTVTDEIAANKISLNHLSNGADGIIFNLKERKGLNLDRLLESIEWPYCTVSFEVTEENFFEKILSDFVRKNYTDRSTLAGSLFWDKFPNSIDPNLFQELGKNFKPFGLKLTSSTPANEICQALYQSVKYFEANAPQSGSDEFFSSISFSIPCSINFLETIAKLKALRMLWFQVARAYGFKQYMPGDLKIHARSEVWIQPEFQPHGNMISATSASMAAIAGGCDSLTVFPENENNEMMSRIARNVSNILREESHMGKVADPLAGAYALENLQHALAEKAWSMFQTKMKNG